MRESVPNLCNNISQKSKDANNDKNAKEFPPIFGAHFGLDVVVGIRAKVIRSRGVWWKAARRLVSLHHGVLLIPPFTQPDVELVVVIQGYIVDAETAPVKVDRLRRPALEIGTRQSKVLFTIAATPVENKSMNVRETIGVKTEVNSRDALVSDGAVVHIVDATLEFLQYKVHTAAPGQQQMFAISDAALFCPFGGSDTAVI